MTRTVVVKTECVTEFGISFVHLQKAENTVQNQHYLDFFFSWRPHFGLAVLLTTGVVIGCTMLYVVPGN